MTTCPAGHWNAGDVHYCVSCGSPMARASAERSTGKLTVTLADLHDPELTQPPRRDVPAPPRPEQGSVESLPRVRRATPVPGRPTPLDDLGVELSVDRGHLIVAHTEPVIGRFGVVSAAWSTPPGALTAVTTSLRLQPTFDGVGELVITADRLIGVLHSGTVGGAAVPAAPGAYVGWDFPLTAVAEVGLDVNERWHGGTEQVGLRIWSFEPVPAMIRLDITSVLDQQMRNQPIDDQREVMRTLVVAACDAHMKNADDEERLRLVQVRAGRWSQEDGSITAEITPANLARPG